MSITGTEVYKQKDSLLAQLKSGTPSSAKTELEKKVSAIEIPSMASIFEVSDDEIEAAAKALKECQIENLTRVLTPSLQKGSTDSPETVTDNRLNNTAHGIG